MAADPYLQEFFRIGAIAAIMTPAPDLLSVLSRSWTQGRDAGFAAVLAVSTSLAAYAAAAILGLGFLLARHPIAFESARWLAIACLIYLAYEAVAPVIRPGAELLPAKPAAAPGAVYRQVLAINLLNPKFFMFFFAFLPQAAGPEQDLLLPWILDLIVLFIIGEGAFLILLALVASWLGGRRTAKPRRRRLCAWIEGLLHAGLAVTLAAA